MSLFPTEKQQLEFSVKSLRDEVKHQQMMLSICERRCKLANAKLALIQENYPNLFTSPPPQKVGAFTAWLDLQLKYDSLENEINLEVMRHIASIPFETDK